MTARSVRISNLSKEFEDETVLKNIDLEVEPGEIFIILGPSGCGKSTLLKCIAGLFEPTEGDIYFNKNNVTGQRPAERDLGYVFQEFEDTLFSHMTVEENIRTPLEERGLDSETIESKINEILDLVSIEELRDDLPGELSGGQQQRVEVARQLVRECSLVLLDDPLADLDYKLQKQMELELRSKHASTGDTYVYVTHNQIQALELGDKLAVMNAGQIEQVGTPSEVYHNPQTAFVGRFVGDSNMIEGQVDDIDKGKIATDVGTLQADMDQSPETDEVVVLVRPEKIQLAPDEGSVDNRLDGQIQGRTFIGDETEFIFFMPEMDNTILVRASGDVSVDSEEVTIGWDSSETLVYDLTELSVDSSITKNDLRELYS